MTEYESHNDKLIEILNDSSRVAELSRDGARRLWLQVNAIGAHLMARWAGPEDTASDEAVLTVAQASEFANVSSSLLYDHWRAMPSAIKIGRALRFKKSGLLADLAALGDDRHRAPIDPPAKRLKVDARLRA